MSGSTHQDIAAALRRVAEVLQRRPEAGQHEDAPALAHWTGGTRVISRHANGTEVASDMPAELGGSGDHITPGWLFRAGLAACATTSIVLAAAAEGIELAALELHVSSRSDTRGLLGLADDAGAAVYPGPGEMWLCVRVAAPGVAPRRLRELVATALARSPVPNALQHPTALALQVDIVDNVDRG